MQSIAEALLEFKIAQLEGKLAIYENLMADIVKLESMEIAASAVKLKLENVIKVWRTHTPEENHAL